MVHEATLRVIERIYETATAGDGWEGALNEIADLAHADNAWLVLAVPELGMNTVIAPRSDPDIIAGYQNHWWAKDVTLKATFGAPVGRITTLKEIGQEQFLSSEFYNDFWKNSGQASDRLVANLIADPGAVASIGLQPSRSEDRIETEMAATFAALMPHLIRSVRIRCTMRRLELERDMARATPRTGVVLVDEKMHILLADEDAERLLEANAHVRCDQGHFGLRDVRDNARLQRLVLSCKVEAADRVKGGRLFCSRGEVPSGLRVDVLPFTEHNPILGPEHAKYPNPLAILALADPARHRTELHEQLRRKFSLTAAEAAVALELVHGDSRAEVARRMGVTQATVRTHMMHIFEKVGVHSRGALIGQMTQDGVDVGLLGP